MNVFSCLYFINTVFVEGELYKKVSILVVTKLYDTGAHNNYFLGSNGIFCHRMLILR